jgi:hypothetical protein
VATAETGGVEGLESQIPITRQVAISAGARNLGLLPTGAEVWLQKDPAGRQGRDVLMYGILPWAFAVRSEKAGLLLLGAVRDATDSSASPVTTGQKISLRYNSCSLSVTCVR